VTELKWLKKDSKLPLPDSKHSHILSVEVIMFKANPLVQIAKKLTALQAKSIKINEEINALADIVAIELKKLEAAPTPAKTAPAKSAPAKATVATKKGRPSKK